MIRISRLLVFVLALIVISACDSPGGPTPPDPPVSVEKTITLVYIRPADKASPISPNEFTTMNQNGVRKIYNQFGNGEEKPVWDKEAQSYTVTVKVWTGISYQGWILDFVVAKDHTIGSPIYLKGENGSLTLLSELACAINTSIPADNRCIRLYYPLE